MFVIAAAGLLFASQPYRLLADNEGLHWSYGTKTQLFRWSEIEEIGIARPKGTEGWNSPVARALTGMSTNDIRRFRRPSIGLNLTAERSRYKDPGKRAYYKGFTGYEVNVPNHFNSPIEAIIDELRVRWRLRGDSASIPSVER